MSEQLFPGIFNDAIGPVMRGPSSSHTAGSHRIGCVIRQLARGSISKAEFLFHPEGSLATTYQTQGSDIGLAAGLLGIDITDEEMPNALILAKKNDLDIRFHITDYPASHPNTYLCRITDSKGNSFELVALSTGGGLIEVQKFNGKSFSRAMDLPLLMIEGEESDLQKFLNSFEKDPVINTGIFKKEIVSGPENSLLIIDFKDPDISLADSYLNRQNCYFVESVYPVPGYTGGILPFKSLSELEKHKELTNKQLWEFAVDYESKRSGIYPEEVLRMMHELTGHFRRAIETGLSGTRYEDRILGAQSPQFDLARKNKKLLPAGPLERITSYIMAIMESKSAMQVIVAAPTAGAAGGLPGTLIGMAEELKLDENELVKAFLAAGLVGVFISQEATFAAEVAGCQAETGAGAGMAAAGLIQLAGGNALQALGAASIALQNVMGLICDPVGNRVEVPCLSRNVQAGGNALVSANMILGGVDPVIPLSETIRTMLLVGQSLPRELRCTALGGLADTPTARRIESKLENRTYHANN